ncbi:MAG: VOC family protein [Chloroflexi bacterium]|nr:VOC family protein [Chloroflexota bacterium]
MGLQLRDITIDCAHPQNQARFWSQALGWKIQHVLTGRTEVTVFGKSERVVEESASLIGGGDGCPRIVFVRVPEPKTVKNRLHLDLFADDLDAEVQRLVKLGGEIVDRRFRSPRGAPRITWVVMKDPEGNEFCVNEQRK